MGAKGLSSSRVFRGYPTLESKLHALHLRVEQVVEGERDEVRELSARLTGRPLNSSEGDKTISLTAEEPSVEAGCEVVETVVGEGTKAEEYDEKVQPSMALPSCASEKEGLT